jgi:hypothetical protein
MLDDVSTAQEKRLTEKCKRVFAPYKRNVLCIILVAKNRLEEVINHSDRKYMKKLTHLHEWQFFLLADLLKDLILRPHLRNDGMRPERIQTYKA